MLGCAFVAKNGKNIYSTVCTDMSSFWYFGLLLSICESLSVKVAVKTPDSTCIGVKVKPTRKGGKAECLAE